MSNIILQKFIVGLIGAVLIISIGLMQINANHFFVEKETFRCLPDDVLITMRVSYNIANGIGPYFNRDEKVLASTSLWWPFLLSPIYKTKKLVGPIYYLAVLSIIITVATFYLCVFCSSNLLSALLFSVFFLTSSSVYAYMSSAWEHVPQTFLVTLALLLLVGKFQPEQKDLRSLAAALVLLALAFLLRPDAVPLMVMPAGALLYRAWRDKSLVYVWPLIFTGLIFTVHFAVMYHFFNDYFPNTYYLKAPSLQFSTLLAGMKYVLLSFRDGGNAIYLLAVLVILSCHWRNLNKKDFVALSSIFLFVGYVCTTGGDCFGGGRFLLVVTPFLMVLLADFLARFHQVASSYARGLLVGLIAVAIPLLQQFPYGQLVPEPFIEYGRLSLLSKMNQTRTTLCDDEAWKALISLSKIIREKVQPSDGQIGLFYLGGLAYYLPEYHIIDFLGKADYTIARSTIKSGAAGHNKWDIDHSLSRNPAVIPFSKIYKAKAEENYQTGPTNPVEYLVANERLKENYVYFPPEQLGVNHSWGLYVRKDLAERFAP